MSLSTEQNFAGGSFLDVEDIIFEEFMSRKTYLGHEPDKLMNLYCTVDRKRGTTKLWLVGNSISRVCPYLSEWDLQYEVLRQKQGTILIKEISTNSFDNEGKEIFVKLAVEFCISTGKSSYTIGQHAEMLNNGSWQVDSQPKLSKSKKDFDVVFRFFFQYKQFKFICEFLTLKENDSYNCFFIYPKYNNFKKNDDLVFSDVISLNPFFQRDIYNISFKNENLQKILRQFREDKIFFSDDLTGTDFKQAIDFVIKR